MRGKKDATHETGLSGNVVASFFPPIIFIYVCMYVCMYINYKCQKKKEKKHQNYSKPVIFEGH